MARVPTMLLLLILIISTQGCESKGSDILEDKVERQIETSAPEVTLTPRSPTIQDKVIETPQGELRVNSVWTSLLNENYSTCIKCHGDVRSFHTVEIIYRIDQLKGLKPRLCTVCHGQKVHNIHKAALEKTAIICETCHSYQGEFIKPEAGEDQLLVCEVCHSNGNYIKIHIEGLILENAQIDEEWISRREGHQCDTCHIGDFEVIHFGVLSSWREKIDLAIEESEKTIVEPLNISYL